MTQVVTTRLPREIVQELEAVSKIEYLDRASLLRKMILEHLKEYLLQKAAEGYQKGELSVEEAATKAKVSVWQMVDYLTANNIMPPAESLIELEEGLMRTRKIWRAN